MYRKLLTKLARTRLDDVLLDEGLMDRATAEEVLAEQQTTGRPLSEILFDRQAIDEWDLARLVATHYGLPFIDVVSYDIPRAAVDLLSVEFCRDMQILPIDVFGDSATFAVVEMPREHVLAEIEEKSGKAPFLYVGARRPIMDVLDGWEKDAKKRRARTAKVDATKAARKKAEKDAADGAPAATDAAEPASPEAAPGSASDAVPEVAAPVSAPARVGVGVLGVLPAAVLALGPAPTGFGVDVASAGALGRVAARVRTKRSLDLPAAVTDPVAPAAAPPAAGGGWESMFDEADGNLAEE